MQMKRLNMVNLQAPTLMTTGHAHRLMEQMLPLYSGPQWTTLMSMLPGHPRPVIGPPECPTNPLCPHPARSLATPTISVHVLQEEETCDNHSNQYHKKDWQTKEFTVNNGKDAVQRIYHCLLIGRNWRVGAVDE